ncbi:unnamed protein product [Mytilus coruscus]|uniref:CxC5 like cysteine cluster associated with KDZ domain-containing protein n=1 Tax=Mytilus coruscus TaxID=42192 RepID=A0A6J8EFW0_MYTCO|nr:unnamed protein product [Mytilus coruscus]
MQKSINQEVNHSTEKLNKSIGIVFEEVKSCDVNDLKMTTEEKTLLALVSKFGLTLVCTLCAVMKHVPVLWPGRMQCILNIVSVMPDLKRQFELHEVQSIINILEKNATITSYFEIIQVDISMLLWMASKKHCQPYIKLILPPVQRCINDTCNGKLYPYSTTNVTFFTSQGPFPGKKAVLRCRTCLSYYHIDEYNVPKDGRHYYPDELLLQWKCASNKVYLSTDLHEFMCESGNHAFVSHHAFAEIYNSVFHDNHQTTKRFLEWNEHVSEFMAEHTESKNDQGMLKCGLQINMTRKNTISAYFNGELEHEVRHRGWTQEIVFNKEITRETVMRWIDEDRKLELYKHSSKNCSTSCKSKGCENLRVIDSCWKVCHCHCMFSVPMEVDGYPLLSFQNVCTSEPKAGSVFCSDHHELLLRHNIQTKKEDFLHYIGCTSKPKSGNDIHFVQQPTEHVEAVTDDFLARIVAITQQKDQENQLYAITGGDLAIRKDLLTEKSCVIKNEVTKRGGKTNFSVRLDGKPRRYCSMFFTTVKERTTNSEIEETTTTNESEEITTTNQTEETTTNETEKKTTEEIKETTTSNKKEEKTIKEKEETSVSNKTEEKNETERTTKNKTEVNLKTQNEVQENDMEVKETEIVERETDVIFVEQLTEERTVCINVDEVLEREHKIVDIYTENETLENLPKETTTDIIEQSEKVKHKTTLTPISKFSQKRPSRIADDILLPFPKRKRQQKDSDEDILAVNVRRWAHLVSCGYSATTARIGSTESVLI